LEDLRQGDRTYQKLKKLVYTQPHGNRPPLSPLSFAFQIERACQPDPKFYDLAKQLQKEQDERRKILDSTLARCVPWSFLLHAGNPMTCWLTPQGPLHRGDR
jgi:hypothetical protein